MSDRRFKSCLVGDLNERRYYYTLKARPVTSTRSTKYFRCKFFFGRQSLEVNYLDPVWKIGCGGRDLNRLPVILTLKEALFLLFGAPIPAVCYISLCACKWSVKAEVLSRGRLFLFMFPYLLYLHFKVALQKYFYFRAINEMMQVHHWEFFQRVVRLLSSLKNVLAKVSDGSNVTKNCVRSWQTMSRREMVS